MTFKEELKKLFKDNTNFKNAVFIGRRCYGNISNNVCFCVEFYDPVVKDNYDVLKVSLLNKKEGVVDSVNINFGELWEKNVGPYLYLDRGQLRWYNYKPTQSDFQKITNVIDKYLEMFREPEQEIQDQYIKME